MEGHRGLTPTEFIEEVLILLRKEFNPDYVSIEPSYLNVLTKTGGYKQDKTHIECIRIWFKIKNIGVFYYGRIEVEEIYDNFHGFYYAQIPSIKEHFVAKYKHYIQNIWRDIILNKE